MKSIFVLGLVVLAALGFWLVPRNHDDPVTPRLQAAAVTAVVATSGTHEGSAELEGGSVVTEIETITGANDGMTLVGRRVDLHVDVQQRANDRAFWVGSPDNRVLVVLGPDDRAGTERHRGEFAGHGISPVRGGQRAAISGVIRTIPASGQRPGWILADADEKDLSDRKIYIHADAVSSQGHGPH